MMSTTDAQELDAVIRYWGNAYTFSYNPRTHPDEPHAAQRRDGTSAPLHAATPAKLLDAIKDDHTAGVSSPRAIPQGEP
jgi:hypothetical protein